MSEGQRRARRPGGLRDMRTATSARVRSKPVTEGQRYLDLYTLKRERARWSRTRQQAEQRIETIDKAIEKLGFPEEITEGPQARQPGTEETIRFHKCPGTRRSA